MRSLSPTAAAVIFDRVSQLGSLADRDEGGGLGLVISKCVVEMIKGTIAVANELQCGSVFSAWLPLPRFEIADLDAGLGQGCRCG